MVLPEFPEEFTNVPLSLLVNNLLLIDELIELSDDFEEKAYWQGRFDGLAGLLADLVGKPWFPKRPRLDYKIKDLQMEDALEDLGIQDPFEE